MLVQEFYEQKNICEILEYFQSASPANYRSGVNLLKARLDLDESEAHELASKIVLHESMFTKFLTWVTKALKMAYPKFIRTFKGKDISSEAAKIKSIIEKDYFPKAQKYLTKEGLKISDYQVTQIVDRIANTVPLPNSLKADIENAQIKEKKSPQGTWSIMSTWHRYIIMIILFYIIRGTWAILNISSPYFWALMVYVIRDIAVKYTDPKVRMSL